MKKIYNLLIALVLLLVPVICLADDAKEPANIYVFYGKGCPHCEEFFTWVDTLSSEEKSKFNLVKYETWYNTTNSTALSKVAEHFNVTEYGVPFIIIGNTYYNGFGESTKEQFLAALDDYYNLDERASVFDELSVDVVADAPEKVEKTKTAVVIVVALAICVGAAGLIFMVSKSEE